LGVSPTQYDKEVLHLTSEISKQVFPFTIDLDNQKVWDKFAKLLELSDRMVELKEQSGIWSKLKRLGLGLQAGATFIGLYLIPVVPNELKADFRLKPVW
jgi:magnesium-protoporphyrin IX monomethyl ester (oxidative) cyclase